jgi:hypothetical protein
MMTTKDRALISPLDARYIGHREAEERHRQTREWLEQRERELGFVGDAPPVVPEKTEPHQTASGLLKTN